MTQEALAGISIFLSGFTIGLVTANFIWMHIISKK